MKPLITTLILLFTLGSYAQIDKRKMQERIEAQKTAFITKQLDLTVAEAEKFWPVFNAFEATIKAIKTKDIRPIKKQMFNSETLSEVEAGKLLTQLINAETKIHNAKLQLVSDLKDIISPVKILKLKAAEDRFNKKLIERLKNMRERRQNKN